MALEEYIKQVKEIWTNYTLDLVNYQNKCRLIRCDLDDSTYLLYTHSSSEDGMTFSINVAKT